MHKILLADDDIRIRAIYRNALEAENCQIIEAIDGDEAMMALLQFPDIEVALLDIDMPVVPGDMFYDVLRLHSPSVRVIISSVYPLEEQKRLVIKADDYFDKSEGIDRLLSKVRNQLEQVTARSRA